jgi:hypothetical protein
MEKGSVGKDLLEKLIFMGKNERVVEIGEVKFTMSSLTEKQNRTLLEKIFGLSEAERLAQSKGIAVASSILKINEFDLETVIGGVEEGETTFDKKIALISKMQFSIVNKLYEAFESINSNVDTGEATENLKNS